MKVFIGWDSRESIAYEVCKHSITKRNSAVTVIPLKQKELIEKKLYTRNFDNLSSTEFTFTRFLVPHMMEYKGWAIFCDSDIIFQVDVEEIFKQANDDYAVMVVKHDYTPLAGEKMDGKTQHLYPRKNWSSVILWNCGHPANAKMTAAAVNSMSNTGEYFHRFRWLNDSQIGSLSHEYNWLVGWYKTPKDGYPKVIHYTEGGPWFPNCTHVEFGAVWEQEKASYIESIIVQPAPKPFDNIPDNIRSVFNHILKYRVDPANEIYGTTIDQVINEIKMLDSKNAVAVDGGRDVSDGKGLGWDPYMESFILGCGGQITTYDKVEQLMSPVIFRGITKHKYMKACAAAGRDYFYIDTGYFGNVRKKFYHRITKNAMQNIGPIIERPFDRLDQVGWRKKKFRPGSNILVCPPSAKAMNAFGLNLDKWMEEIISTIKQHTDRPIVIRQKVSRRERSSTDTMEMALADNVHCLVTYNSIAASEALLLGKPAFTLGPNAAHQLCLDDLSQIENPYIPSLDELALWAAHLAYCQFSEADMRNGTAWRILNEDPATQTVYYPAK
jgi:lipopolysaccharide biosynthesis glycosyltransferase